MRLLAVAIGRFPGDHRRSPNLTRHPAHRHVSVAGVPTAAEEDIASSDSTLRDYAEVCSCWQGPWPSTL